MKKLVLLSIVLSFSVLACSCSGLIMKLMGMHKNRVLDKKEIVSYSLKYKIPPADNLELDTMYIRFIRSIDTLFYADQRKNHYQPLQALYYDREGKQKVFIINCYTRGFPNLKWNRGKILNTFLPKQQAPLDSLLPLHEQLKYLRPLPGSDRLTFGIDDYTVVVYWSYFMGRQSKRLIKAIQKNVKLAGGKKVRMLYVNNDNFFAKLP